MHIGFLAARELHKIEKEYPQIASHNETVDKLIAGASLARYGDGELGVCIGRTVNYTNSYNPKLKKRLLEILHAGQNETFLVGMPTMNFVSGRQRLGVSFFQQIKYWFGDVFCPGKMVKKQKYSFYERFMIYSWRFLKQHITDNHYESANISRSESFKYVSIEKYRQIWQNRNVVFIVPQNGRFVEDPRLFDNIKSQHYIYVDPADAFADYGNIYRLACNYLTTVESPLFLIAAGMTATVLAYDLHNAGCQAIDIGHLPNCYQEFLGEAPQPEATPIIQKQK